MPQPASPIRRALQTTELGLEEFKKIVTTSKGEIPQQQVDAFIKKLSKQMEQLQNATRKASIDASASTGEGELADIEKRIVSSISFIQTNPKTQHCKGNLGNTILALREFLSDVKTQVTQVKKKRNKVERAGNVENEQL